MLTRGLCINPRRLSPFFRAIASANSHRTLSRKPVVESQGCQGPIGQRQDPWSCDRIPPRVDADLLQRSSAELNWEAPHCGELGAVGEATRPGEDRGDRVGRSASSQRLVAFLSEVAVTVPCAASAPTVWPSGVIATKSSRPTRAEALRHPVSDCTSPS